MKKLVIITLLAVIFFVSLLFAQSYNTTWVGSIYTTTKAFDVKIVGRLAYVVGWDEDYWGGYYGSFSIIDVYFPSAPNLLSTFYINDAYGIDVNGDYAYVAESNYLLIINISNPANPYIEGGRSLPGSGKDVKLVGSLAYVADGYAGLRIIDVSNPSNPVEIGYYDSPGITYDVEINNTIAYLADYTGGFICLDISTPSNPVLISQYPAGDAVIDIELIDTLAFYTDGYAGIKVLDIADIENPTLVGSLSLPYWCLGLKLSDKYAYVAAWEYGGLRIIDISNPAGMREVGYYNTEGKSRDVDFVGPLVYVADWDWGGLQILNNDLINPASVDTSVINDQLPTVSLLEQNYPNPFNPVTLIKYQLPERSYVTLKIYDVLGTEIETIVDGEKEAGYYQFSFDGSNLPSGIYFYSLRTKNNCITRKMILLK